MEEVPDFEYIQAGIITSEKEAFKAVLLSCEYLVGDTITTNTQSARAHRLSIACQREKERRPIIISLHRIWLTSTSPDSTLTAELDFSAAINGSKTAEGIEAADRIYFQYACAPLR